MRLGNCIPCVAGVAVCLFGPTSALSADKPLSHFNLGDTVRSIFSQADPKTIGEVTLEEFVKQAFPELKLLFPGSNTVQDMIKSLSDLIQNLESTDPKKLPELAKAFQTLAKMKPETLEKLIKAAPKSAKGAEAMKKFMDAKKLSIEALAEKLRKAGEGDKAERLAAYFALVERMGKKKMNVGAVIAPKTVTDLKNIIPKLRKEISPLAKKHKEAFLHNDPKAKAAFFKELGDKIMEYDKKNGGVLAGALDPSGTKDLVNLLRKAQKDAGIPPVEGHLFLPKKETDELYSTLINELTAPLVDDIRNEATAKALHGVNSQRIPPYIRSGAQVGAPQGAIDGAMDGAFGKPRRAMKPVGRVRLLRRRMNVDYGENRGYNEAYAQAYNQARAQRLAGEQEMRDSVKLVLENLVNKQFEGMGSLQVHYLKENKVVDGSKMPDYSYLSFFEGKETYASFRLGALDNADLIVENFLKDMVVPTSGQ